MQVHIGMNGLSISFHSWYNVEVERLITAYVMLNTELGHEGDSLEALKEVPEVTESYILYGVYDILVKVEAPSREELSRLITRKIRGIENIRNTITFIVLD
jgi:DNA-binding Lrp family transcriptional regulator